MKVSIITVTYNSDSFLKSCIDSILSQTYNEIEHIIIDGNSNDTTLDLIKEYNHLKWISEDDSGIYDAMNKGIKLATGDIIGILNSDDFFADNGVISRIVNSFVSNDVDALYANVMFVNRNDVSKIFRSYSSKYFKPWMFKFGFQPAHPTFYVKRDLFKKHGVYRTDLKIAGDFELLLRFLLKNKVRYQYVNDLWVKMRVGGASTSGLSSVVKLNSEIMKAHTFNNLYTNMLLVYSKYLVKWWGFVKK